MSMASGTTPPFGQSDRGSPGHNRYASGDSETRLSPSQKTKSRPISRQRAASQGRTEFLRCFLPRGGHQEAIIARSRLARRHYRAHFLVVHSSTIKILQRFARVLVSSAPRLGRECWWRHSFAGRLHSVGIRHAISRLGPCSHGTSLRCNCARLTASDARATIRAAGERGAFGPMRNWRARPVNKESAEPRRGQGPGRVFACRASRGR